jgi:hypothetical protein
MSGIEERLEERLHSLKERTINIFSLLSIFFSLYVELFQKSSSFYINVNADPYMKNIVDLLFLVPICLFILTAFFFLRTITFKMKYFTPSEAETSFKEFYEHRYSRLIKLSAFTLLVTVLYVWCMALLIIFY